MATLHEHRHFRLSNNFLRLLTAPYIWETWCKFCCCKLTPEDSLERCFFQSYNVRTRPRIAERDRAGWQPLLQRSLRHVVLGEDSGMSTARLGKSKNSDDKVHCFVVRYDGVTGVVLYTFNEPGKSRRALEALYGARPNNTRLANKDILQHIEVSYVDASSVLRTPFVMTLITELRTVGDNDPCSAQSVDNFKEGSHRPAAQDTIVLITDAQRRASESDKVPTSNGEESLSSGDDTLAAGSGVGSSTHNLSSGDTAGAVGGSAEEKADVRVANCARDVGGRAEYDIHDVGDSDTNDEDDEDEDDRVSDAGAYRAPVKTTGIDEFGVLHRNHADQTTIRARLVPSEAPRVLRRAPSRGVFHALRNVLGIKQ